MSVLLLFSFLAGMVTILAPCIWPLLPIVLSASSTGGKRKPLGITLGVMTSFTIFTLSISYLEKILRVDANLFRLIAVLVIGFLGLSMMVPPLGARLESFINRALSSFQNRIQIRVQTRGTGFWAGYVTGFSIGLVWAPCAGPILATIATLAATQAVNARVVLVTLAYVAGLGIPLFLFSLSGVWFFSRMRRLTKYTGRIQQGFGLVMIVAALLIYTNYDKVIQVKILESFPSYGNFLSKVENNEQVTRQLKILRGEKEMEKKTPQANPSGLPDLGPAPEFAGIAQWLNASGPLSMADLRGKVVLIDFWTYSCVNCVRTLPHVTGWYEKYKDKNFVVIGVHTPEFAFEKKTENVRNALKQFKINYPVAQDNEYRTWQAFKNHYWPAEYLIDAKGRIRRTHFGEGHYEEMELAIKQLLAETGNSIDEKINLLSDETPRYRFTPETYLGKARMERFFSNEPVAGGQQTFTRAEWIPPDNFVYEGNWDVSQESAKAHQGSILEIHFRADKVFLVVSPRDPGDRIKILLDGQIVDEATAGADVKNGEVVLQEERLYHLIDLHGNPGSHLLRLEFQNNGISVYAFTFG